MTVLIHLNGPSGVGKSTLAGRYADDHPGTLLLDVDEVVSMIGGWRGDFFGTLAPARELALVMAGHHLAGGHDVVVPQLVTDPAEAERFERVAADAGATYVEVVLLVDPDEQVRRFREKSGTGGDVATAVATAIDTVGGDAVLGRIHGHVEDYLAHRPGAATLITDDLGPEEASAGLALLLAARR